MYGGSLEETNRYRNLKEMNRYLFNFTDIGKLDQFMDYIQQKGYNGSFTLSSKPYIIAVEVDSAEYKDLEKHFRESGGEWQYNKPYNHKDAYTPPENAVDMTGGTGTYNTGSNSSGYIRESDKYKRR